MTIKIGTRGSKLARTQAEYVKRRLEETYTDIRAEICVIRTTGDRILDRPLHEIGGKGLFVKEIEEKLLSGEIQIAVHSMKDMPEPAPGLVFSRTWKREDNRDVLILREKKNLSELPEGAVIGTGSVRRKAELNKLRPDLQVVGIRGNIDTRLRKMEEEKFDGIVLAAAGLKRLGLAHRITQYLEVDEMLPAPAQGALAIELLEKNVELKEKIDALWDEESHITVEMERKFMRTMGGGCHAPIGACATSLSDGSYRFRAMYGEENGENITFSEVTGREAEAVWMEAARQIREERAGENPLATRKGCVYLVGAGPGAADLITVRGHRLLQQAECVVYDRLISKEMLREVPEGCEWFYVGKENHHHIVKQDEINRLLVEKASQYKKVIRLKGGDPYVFGRGGEEGLYLREHGVAFEVVPGVTSAVAAPAYAGIPVTHRGITGGFHVLTAHNRMDELADIDFPALAKSKDTCIFLMGLSKLGEIAEQLIRAGRNPEQAAAVIAQATMPEQKCVTGTLQDIEKKVREAELCSPAVIVVGDVVSLREKLNQNKTYRFLLPKIGTEDTKLASYLRKYGNEVEEVQVGEIQYEENVGEYPCIKNADWLIFTSRHAVKAMFHPLSQGSLPSSFGEKTDWSGVRIAAIGESTKKYLEKYGLKVDLIPDETSSIALAEMIKGRVEKHEQVVYVRAAQAADELGDMLRPYCQWNEVIAYENVPVEISLSRGIEEYDGILFTCASAVERMFGDETTGLSVHAENRMIYSIGNKTTEALRAYGVKHVRQAKKATYQSLAEKVFRELLSC